MTVGTKKQRVVIIGAGPAGLTAAYELNNRGVDSVVLEKDEVVGGISRTVRYKEFLFDIGGHRFFTKVPAVEKMWTDVLGDDLLHRKRLSRIFYNKRFFHYPLKPANALLGLGFGNSLLCFLSYLKAQLAPIRDERTFEDWVSNRFGRRIYRTFFKTYTEKVWGIPCNRIAADWAAQRIKGLSLMSALRNALFNDKHRDKSGVVKTLVDTFDYPKHGPGMLWERVAKQVAEGHAAISMSSNVKSIRWNDNRVEAVEVATPTGTQTVLGTDFISSMPVRELIASFDPPLPKAYLEAAAKLKYRDFLTVALIVNGRDLFPDNWIYIHDPEVRVGRVQNFNNWSPFMSGRADHTCLGLEYFCFEGDELWIQPDEALIELGKREMRSLDLINPDDVVDGAVVRMPKAYPVYDDTYAQALSELRVFIDGIENLQLVGRNGMHKYNNQDHSMLTAMLAVENIMGARFDLWSVNVDESYHEELSTEEDMRIKDFAALKQTQPLVPTAVPENRFLDDVLIQAFARTDKLALAGAIGIVCALYVMLGTFFLVFKGGETIGPHAALLGQYFSGYSVTHTGALVGGLYGFIWGFLLGWLIAYLRNAFLGFYLFYIKRRAEAHALRNFLNYI